ncbi:DNA mismatch repair endonuclease MutL [Saccharicrinis fermentans]|uniref:DNA mismatch repair protein MutL n=1 Tax=Saccharicrinis fermentans DSM 9555 = JCM 21142 TaxID=869213 RepID=W7Y0W3_9BACT|nr:DNA mismatch repair endonuclease MutL [Saccharicrinis fermentans]GAF01587.1 DNA mismatch repair protein MutL [Saccharicrinis fermentans DSM 9555 = JCM 21142]
MSDIIQLLPDSVANQIAAGEVIQRPGSMLKELVENAIDAGSTDIKIIIKDAGRTLVQVIDNGCGMSATDARLAFERHATSKIKDVNDLFAIRTMGFRGEALASIAAVAQTELKTKKHGDELGTHLVISGSQVESQEVISCPTGSNFIVRNLFYNVPARRKFLKKDSTELRHIINEFQRIVLANPDISFSLEHNNMPLFQLPVSNLRQRIINIAGKNMNHQLVPVETNTTLVKINGFIGKPEAARKSSGDQFFFVNQRYMRHPYLHKAITEAYSNLILPNTIPAYFLYFEVDPKIIDINIHPTKTEIKFEDERAIWHILNATIKESLGKHNMIPTIDFDTADMVNIPVSDQEKEKEMPEIEVNPYFNPFDTPTPDPSSFGAGSSVTSSSNRQETRAASPGAKGWEQLYNEFEAEKGSMPFDTPDPSETITTSNWESNTEPQQQTFLSEDSNVKATTGASCFQFKNKYILTSGKSGLMMVDQKRAHERILFERLMLSITNKQSMTQQSLFPEQLEFNVEDSMVVKELLGDLKLFGFDMAAIGDHTYEVKGMPINMEKMNPKMLLDEIINDFKAGEINLEADLKERIARSIAKQSAIKSGQFLSPQEMDELIGQLFACQIPNYSPDGKPVISILSNDEIDMRFK